jgi:hypothetical protein
MVAPRNIAATGNVVVEKHTVGWPLQIIILPTPHRPPEQRGNEKNQQQR